MFILTAFVIVLGFVAYMELEKKENQVVNSLETRLGKHISSFTLSSCQVAGKEWRSWGMKLYLFSNGMALSDPSHRGETLPFTFDEIRELEGDGCELTFYSRIQETYLPQKIELSTSPFGAGLASLVHQAYSNN